MKVSDDAFVICQHDTVYIVEDVKGLLYVFFKQLLSPPVSACRAYCERGYASGLLRKVSDLCMYYTLGEGIRPDNIVAAVWMWTCKSCFVKA